MKDRLFSSGGSYTEEANILSGYIYSAVANEIIHFLKKYPNTDIRDISLIVLNASSEAATGFILYQKDD
jgi:hypothetical protein